MTKCKRQEHRSMDEHDRDENTKVNEWSYYREDKKEMCVQKVVQKCTFDSRQNKGEKTEKTWVCFRKEETEAVKLNFIILGILEL